MVTTPHNCYESPTAEVVVVKTENVICQSSQVSLEDSLRQDYGDPINIVL